MKISVTAEPPMIAVPGERRETHHRGTSCSFLPDTGSLLDPASKTIVFPGCGVLVSRPPGRPGLSTDILWLIWPPRRPSLWPSSGHLDMRRNGFPERLHVTRFLSFRATRLMSLIDGLDL